MRSIQNSIVGLILFTVVTALLISCDKKKAEEIVVYPNPATTYIIFDATKSADKHKNGTITIKNTVGALIETFKTDDSSLITWQIDSFARGIYFYTYEADKMKSQSGKIQFN